MGERLVLDIILDDECILNFYYHWDAFTLTALKRIKSILEVIGDDRDKRSIQYKLIRYCESEGGGITHYDTVLKDYEDEYYEYDLISNLWPDEVFEKENIDRSNGLVSISKQGYEDSHSWEDGSAVIDLDNKIISLDCFYGFGSYDELLRDCSTPVDERPCFKHIIELKYDITSFSFDELDTIISDLAYADNLDTSIVKCGDCYYKLIR